MIEKEIILLRSVYDHIYEMVNHSMLRVRGDKPHQSIAFIDSAQRKLFFILLVDFLSVTDKRGPIKQISFLAGLKEVCANPQFSVNSSEQELSKCVNDFVSWLREEKEIYIWLPDINEEVNISISRIDAIKMSGDVSKHNYLRSISVAERLRTILNNSDITIDLENAMVSLPDFYERFHEDILIYLSSHICEFLNNITLGIRTYLQPEFERSYQPSHDPMKAYSYLVPAPIKSRYARNSYWELMNAFRFKPCFEKFHVSEYLKSDEY